MRPSLIIAAYARRSQTRPEAKLQLAVCRATVLFPNFLSTCADLLLGASRLKTLLQPLPQILDPGAQPLHRRLVTDTRGNPRSLFDLALEIPGPFILIHRTSPSK